MSDSLRDQLLGLGFKPAPKPVPKQAERKPGELGAHSGPPHARRTHARGANDAKRPQGKAGRGGAQQDARKPPCGAAHGARPQARDPQHAGAPRRGGEMDLAKAYAIRAQKEKAERIEAERQKQEAARLRREAKARLAELLKDKSLNAPEADIARHFEYGGKIKRIHVTAEQLPQLNAGALGVVQIDGRYLLVDAATLGEAEAVFAPAIALKVDPNAPAQDDPYADPKFQVPDDLVW